MNRRRLRRLDLTVLLFTAPGILAFVIFVVGPALVGLRLSFYRWNLISPMAGVGLQNFRAIFADPVFWTSLRNSLELAAVGPLVQTVVALGLALALLQLRRGRLGYRLILYAPMTMSAVAIGLVWAEIYNPEFGLLNSTLNTIGLHGLAQTWLGNPHTALPALLFVSLWRWTGFNVVIYLAALQLIPPDLYEAADLDGASRWRKLVSITLPMIAPFTFLQLVVNMLGYLRFFDLVYVTTSGGPANATEVLPMYIYQHAFQYFDIGGAAAATVVSLFAGLVITTVFALFARFSSGFTYRGVEQ